MPSLLDSLGDETSMSLLKRNHSSCHDGLTRSQRGGECGLGSLVYLFSVQPGRNGLISLDHIIIRYNKSGFEGERHRPASLVDDRGRRNQFFPHLETQRQLLRSTCDDLRRLHWSLSQSDRTSKTGRPADRIRCRDGPEGASPRFFASWPPVPPS